MKKLRKILLMNWLYFSKQLIDVGDVNFLTGKNGAGKSTVIDALQIVLLGETNARNFNQAANEKSQRTLNGYLRADMDEHSPASRRGKDFSSYIACEFQDDVEGACFVTGIVFDCHNDNSRQERYFIYDGRLPENCFIEAGEAMDISALRAFLRQNYGNRAKLYDTQKQYRIDMLAKWNVHNEQVLRMLKRAVSFHPIGDIQKFITENICEIPEKPNIEAMQQTIRDYKRHEQLAQYQEKKLSALVEICGRYRDLNQAVERWEQHSFLALWAHKAVLLGEIAKRETEMQDCLADIGQAETESASITREIQQKEQRKEELTVACANSDVYQEEMKLRASKSRLEEEQKRLLQQLQKAALEIKREAYRLTGLCDAIQEWEHDEIIFHLQNSSETVRKEYSLFVSCEEQVFAKPLAIFERAQAAAADFTKELRNAAYRMETRLSGLKSEWDEKRAALDRLHRNVKDYPKGLLRLKGQLCAELEKRSGRPASIEILADVLEISEKEEIWRGAAEGYLNTQKFYLLVEPAHYSEALAIYDRIKREYPGNSFGLVDVGKLRENERLIPQDNSLALKIETKNALARSYIDYLLGHVICCADAGQLRQYKTALTADGMLYQGYVARPLRKEQMENAFIGRRAVALQIHRLEAEISEIRSAVERCEPVYQSLAAQKDTDPLFSLHFIQSVVVQRQEEHLRRLKNAQKLDEIDDRISHLNLLWLEEQRSTIRFLTEKIEELRRYQEELTGQKARLEERIRHLEGESLPEQRSRLDEVEDQLHSIFSSEFIEKIGIPRYQQELDRLKKPAAIFKNFNDQLMKTQQERNAAQAKLFQARRDYAEDFKPCAFRVDSMDNDEYEAERKFLEESELPQYRDKIKAARESAMEQFQSDFLAKLKASIDQVEDQVKSLNRVLKNPRFGTDRYQFRVERNPDYASYYDMIMAPESMEGSVGLFALPFQQKYGALMEDLFGRITMADDTQLNARKQSELQENIERYTDFRTYLRFDLETTDQNGSRQMLSQTLNKKSGGETQTPFYIAVLASFSQLYQVNNLSSIANNTVRLVLFDEAFNKMDSDRIVESVCLLRDMGLQAIICTPPDKVQDIMPIADRTLLVDKNKYQMQILSYGKEFLGK